MDVVSRITFLPPVLCFLFNVASLSQGNDQKLPGCEWCGADEAPSNVSWLTTIAGKDEPGQRIIIRGKVTKADGVSPASDVVLYVYHTNAKGIYGRKGNETGNGRRHGYLRGWMKTDSTGRYEFRTIRPGAYPGGTNPEHVHVTVKEAVKQEYWIDDFHFEDDPLLTPASRTHLQNRGGSGVLTLKPGRDGIPEAVRNITLLK